MRVGVPFSVALHLALAAAGVIVVPQLPQRESSPMVVLPVELLTIGDTTNVIPVVEEQPEAPVAEEASAEAEPEPAPAEAETAEAEPIPEPEAEIIPEPEPEPEPEKPEPKPAPKPEPKPEPKPDFNDSLSSILQSVERPKENNAPNSDRTAADLRNVENQPPRRGAGDNRQMTITVADFIRSQLISRGCWADQDDMADAKRLRAVIRIRFERDGRLLGSPELIEPSREPSADRPMQIFIQRARRALNQCSPFTVPAEYYAVSPPQWIDIEFLP